LLALALLACDVADDAPAPAPAPVERTAPRAPAKPARESGPQKSRPSKSTMQAEGSSYYQYVDETGHVRIAASLDQVPERQRSTAGHISVSPTAAPSPRRSLSLDDSDQAKVVVYSTETCPVCKKAIKYLDSTGTPYVNKDVQQDPAARDEYLKITNGRDGVPLVVVGRKWMQGWDQAKFDQMLAAAAEQP
jgi:glutaredoxin